MVHHVMVYLGSHCCRGFVVHTQLPVALQAHHNVHVLSWTRYSNALQAHHNMHMLSWTRLMLDVQRAVSITPSTATTSQAIAIDCVHC